MSAAEWVHIGWSGLMAFFMVIGILAAMKWLGRTK